MSAHHSKTAHPCLDIFAAEKFDNPSRQRGAAGFWKPNEQQTVMSSWLKFANV
jgi:hypothetical protein